MSKFENNIISNIKTLSLDMINECGSGNKELQISSANIFYNLFLNHYVYNIDDDSWLNEDKLFVSNLLLPSFYSARYMFGLEKNIENLKEFKKLNSSTTGYKDSLNVPGDIVGISGGVALGERYLEDLINIENSKANLINYHTYLVCTLKELNNGGSFETLKYIAKNKLNKLVIIAIKGYDEDSSDIYDYLKSINYDIIEINNKDVDDAIDEAKETKKPSIIIVEDNKKELSEEELRRKYNLDIPFQVKNEYLIEIKNIINKRLSKTISKWNESLNENIKNNRIKSVLEFIKNKKINVDLNVDNLKVNDNYEEELIKGNSKIFNVVANKSEFMLNCSDNFDITLMDIHKSKLMNKDNTLYRNILFDGLLSMGSISLGLAHLGFKVFVSTSLINSNILLPYIKYSSLNKLDIHYTFTQDSFINTNDTVSPTYEINSLRLIPNLINFRPADIDEIIGTYAIISSMNIPTTMVVGSEKIPKLIGTNPKYVAGGAYRVRREKGEANGVIIATGSEVVTAIKLSEELFPYGIDLRIVTMPSMELFDHQSERYKSMLLNNIWNKYVTNSDYILGLDTFTTNGTKEELLKHYKLDMDSLKARIIEKFKN